LLDDKVPAVAMPQTANNSHAFSGTRVMRVLDQNV
jgi:hypothetical protein